MSGFLTQSKNMYVKFIFYSQLPLGMSVRGCLPVALWWTGDLSRVYSTPTVTLHRNKQITIILDRKSGLQSILPRDHLHFCLSRSSYVVIALHMKRIFIRVRYFYILMIFFCAFIPLCCFLLTVMPPRHPSPFCFGAGNFTALGWHGGSPHPCDLTPIFSFFSFLIYKYASPPQASPKSIWFLLGLWSQHWEGATSKLPLCSLQREEESKDAGRRREKIWDKFCFTHAPQICLCSWKNCSVHQ